MSQTTIVLDTVYESLTSDPKNKEVSQFASIEVSGGTVNMYMSNRGEDDKPADKNSMTLTTKSPYATDVFSFGASARWILFELATGTPVVRTSNIIKG